MRKQLIQILEWNAKRRLRGQKNLIVAPSAKIRYRMLNLRESNLLTVGEGSVMEGTISFEREQAKVSIGRNAFFGASHIVCASSVEVGDDVQVSWGCTIIDSDLHSISWSQRKDDTRDWWYQGKKDWSHVVTRPVKLGNKCWVGMHSLVLKGVEIGEGAVVAAGSVVTENVPPWTIAGGNPAKVIWVIPVEDR